MVEYSTDLSFGSYIRCLLRIVALFMAIKALGLSMHGKRNPWKVILILDYGIYIGEDWLISFSWSSVTCHETKGFRSFHEW